MPISNRNFSFGAIFCAYEQRRLWEDCASQLIRLSLRCPIMYKVKHQFSHQLFFCHLYFSQTVLYSRFYVMGLQTINILYPQFISVPKNIFVCTSL